MERTIEVWARGVLCVLALSLSACNFDGNGSADPAATPPISGNPPGTAPVNPGVSNATPQIAGNPGEEVRVGSQYSFLPSASDADGDDLVFTIEGKPTWAAFSASTGRLSGRPTAADVGSYEDIVIRVSDGIAARELPQFSINVVEHAGGAVTLAWQPPTHNTDGSALTDLSGYRIHYGVESGNYDQVIDVDNAGVTSYVLDNLSPGTYYFAISAIANGGIESDTSHEASKTI